MKTYDISSADNATFKLFKNCLKGSEIAETGQALIFGRKTVPEIISAHPSSVIGLIVIKDDADELPEHAARVPNLYRLSAKLFNDLDVFGSRAPIAVIKVPEIKPWKPSPEFRGCALFIPFQDPVNMGTSLRSAAAFGVHDVILGPGSAHPFHPKSSRSASGTLFVHRYFKWREGTPLGGADIKIIGLDKSGEDVGRFTFPDKFILVPGVEGPGLTCLTEKFKFDSLLSIEIISKVESLNASVATGIALHHFFSRRQNLSSRL